MKYRLKNIATALALFALTACGSDSKKSAVDQIDSTKMVNDSSDYTAPEQMVARAYSISKFTELRNLCNWGYVFVTLTPDGVFPASASAELDSLDLHWHRAGVVEFDTSAILFKPPRMNFSRGLIQDPSAQTLRQFVGHTVTVEVVPLEINLYMEVLLVKENQTIIALGFVRL